MVIIWNLSEKSCGAERFYSDEMIEASGNLGNLATIPPQLKQASCKKGNNLLNRH